MAGDWIKVEHATADKPEIARIADLLGIKHNEALGMMVCFWVWCDRHSRNGVVTHMSRTTLDSVTHTPGFAACLIDVGWAVIDDETGAITLPNHDRHNGTPAKTRALGKDRASAFRNAETVTNALPDKNRLDKRKTNTARTRATPLPEDFEISERVKAWAAEKGFGLLDRHLEAFLGKVRAKGYTYIDWDEAFMNCIREDWGKVNAARPLPEKRASHSPAKFVDFGPRTEMPQHISAELAKFKAGGRP